jgi:hypothetical protein
MSLRTRRLRHQLSRSLSFNSARVDDYGEVCFTIDLFEGLDEGLKRPRSVGEAAATN